MSSWGGTSSGDHESPQDVDPVVIDAYGIKVPLRPSDLPEPEPESWADVRNRLHRHLLRLAVLPTALLVELLEGVTKLIRGTTSLPTALSDRIQEAHNLADLREEQRQSTAASHGLIAGRLGPEVDSGDRVAHLVARLEVLLEQMRARGRDGTVILLRDETIVVILGTAEEAREQITAVAAQTVLRLSTTAADRTAVNALGAGASSSASAIDGSSGKLDG